MFLLESWVDLNRKIGKQFEPWVDLNQNLGIHLSHELILSQFLEKPLKSWVESIQVSEILLESWADLNQFVGTVLEWKAQKGHTKSTVGKVDCPKKVKRNWEWIASLSHELIRIKILKSFLSRELNWIKIMEAFLVVSPYDSNFRHPF